MFSTLSLLHYKVNAPGTHVGVQLVGGPGSIPGRSKVFFNGFCFYEPQQIVTGHS